ncbi:MAG: hypothetical protein HRT65_05060 [Flavobacteriaceae bacterium]|nr:hypothetical protein [Flavobacteriaceae bacterium]
MLSGIGQLTRLGYFYDPMRIQFRKFTAKPSTLSCIRADGSMTWTTLHPGTEGHDLAHFAVEKVLGFQKAFYGLLSAGFEIQDFELPKEERPKALWPKNLPQEALVTEHLVNLLTISSLDTQGAFDLLATLVPILESNALELPAGLDHRQCSEIQREFKVLWGQWVALQPGETLELHFPE